MLTTRCSLILATCTLALLTVAITPPAQAENWTHRPDLGGWLDNETGLVWGQSSRVWMDSVTYNYYGALSNGIPAYQQMTGNPKWRLPTLAEAQTAAAHNGYVYFSQSGDTSVMYMWTSTTQGKKQGWMVTSRSGNSKLTSVNSTGGFRAVYRP